MFKHSIRNKLITLTILAAFIPIGISIFITYEYTKESLKKHAIKESITLISEGKRNIVHHLDVITGASLTIYSNIKIDSLLNEGIEGLQSDNYIYTILQNVSNVTSNIHQIYFNSFTTQSSYLFYKNNLKRGPINYEPPFQKSGLEPYKMYTENTHLSHDYGLKQIQADRPEWVFTIHRPVYKVPSNDQIGLMSIDIKIAALRELTSQLYVQGTEDFYIVDKAGNVIFSTMDGKIGKKLNELWIKQILNNSDDKGYLEWNYSNDEGIFTYSKIDNSYLNWTIVKFTPSSYLYKYANNLTFINMAVAGSLLIITLIAIVLVTIKLTKPFKQLVYHIGKIQAGHLHEKIEINRNDEFGIVAERLQAMMRMINGLIDKEYKLQIENKTNQLKMLQAQINPHFINNALQSIGNLALENENKQVYTLISSLGQMMHYSMDTTRTFVSLQQEIDYVHYYITMQIQRFGNRLQYQYTIDEESKLISIPKMTVQPIVENYFKHGFNSGVNKVESLKITTLIEEDKLFIIVEDNGMGITGEDLELLNEKISLVKKGKEEIGNSIGLMNVLYRLYLYYGDDADMKLVRLFPSGLQVMISIPLTKGDN